MKNITLATATALSLLAASLAPAHADWWSRNIAPIGKGVEKTFHSIVKNPVEILPVCWGSPQKCRDENMPGDTKTTPAPTTAPAPVEASASATSICVQPDGEGGAIAWFWPMRPTQYQQSSPITVTNQKQCGRHTIDGAYLTAPILTISPTGWTETTFANGAKVWQMRGRIY